MRTGEKEKKEKKRTFCRLLARQPELPRSNIDISPIVQLKLGINRLEYYQHTEASGVEPASQTTSSTHEWRPYFKHCRCAKGPPTEAPRGTFRVQAEIPFETIDL